MLVNDCKMSILCMFIDQEHPKRRNRETFWYRREEFNGLITRHKRHLTIFQVSFSSFLPPSFFIIFLWSKESKIFILFLLIARMLYLLLLVICGDAWKWFFFADDKREEWNGTNKKRRRLGPLINFVVVVKRNPF